MINTSFPSQNLLIWYPNFGDKDQEMIVSWTEGLHVSCMLEFSVFQRCYLCWWPLIPRKDITIWMGWIHFLSSFPNFTSNGSASPLQSVGWVQVRSIQWWIWVSNNYATVKRSADTGEALCKIVVSMLLDWDVLDFTHLSLPQCKLKIRWKKSIWTSTTVLYWLQWQTHTVHHFIKKIFFSLTYLQVVQCKWVNEIIPLTQKCHFSPIELVEELHQLWKMRYFLELLF